MLGTTKPPRQPPCCIMAKPFLLTQPDSSISQNRHSSHSVRRRPKRSSQRIHAPSPTLLSVLATIAASSHVTDASPAPLPFLCPSLSWPTPSPQPARRRQIDNNNDPFLSSLPTPSPSPTKVARAGRPLPLKFAEGTDGVWRFDAQYALYGSTLCPNSCQDPTDVASPDSANSMNSASAPDSTADPVDLTDTLPAGWLPSATRNESRTTLILALSLVLAFFICFFIIGCLFWRKSLRRKYKLEEDLEMRNRGRTRSLNGSPASSQLVLNVEKDAKAKQKLWARATARWKANARYTARQRKGKRPASIRSQPIGSTTSLDITNVVDHHDNNILGSSSGVHNSSFNHSRRPSCDSLCELSLPLPNQPDQAHIGMEQIRSDSIPESHCDVVTLPPAYRRRTLTAPTALPSGELLMSNHNNQGSLSSLHLSTTSFGGLPIQAKCPSQPQDISFPSTAVHAAHVATDDKGVLARLAAFAERPPNEEMNNPGSSHPVSAPLWEDERLEDFVQVSKSEHLEVSCSTSHSPFPPPPPSKGKMAEAFYDHPYAFEEFSNSLEPEMEPSAPPFEDPCACLTAELMLPSAPPLPEEDYPSDTHLATLRPDAAAESSALPCCIEGNSNGCATDHFVSPAQRPLSVGTLPDYQP